MCSRVTLDGSVRIFAAAMFPALERAAGLAGRLGDILPTDPADVIHVPAGKSAQEWRRASWGFLPPGERDPRKQAQFINARAETLLERPLWREAARNPAQRCVIPVSGFYEWPAGLRHTIRPARGDGFLIAGLLSWAMGPEGRFFTFTVVTTAPSAEFAPFHDRMPALLDREAAERWMTEADAGAAVALLRPAPEGTLAAEESPTKPVQERLL
jgi:putative SOS response-associated peptidase YedK